MKSKIFSSLGIIAAALIIAAAVLKVIYPIRSSDIWYKGSELSESADSKAILRTLEKQIDSFDFLSHQTKSTFLQEQLDESRDNDIYVEFEPAFMFTLHMERVNKIGLFYANEGYNIVINDLSCFRADDDTVQQIRELLEAA